MSKAVAITIDVKDETETEQAVQNEEGKNDASGKPLQPVKRSKSFSSRRLGRRKRLFIARKWISDAALILSLIGIFLMIFESEMSAALISGYEKGSGISHGIKAIISVSTLLLEISIVTYHVLQMKLFLIDNFATDWRIAMTFGGVVRLAVEMIVCVIHPFPGGNFTFVWPEKVKIDAASTTTAAPNAPPANRVPLDVVLSILMFLRLYLIIRVVSLHSRLFSKTTSRSIGALNHVSFNTTFVFKTLMNNCPGTILSIFVLLYWLIASWCMHACERWGGDVDRASFLNQTWLIAITFLTVGYGDTYPLTYCGRAIAIITGIVGVGCSSLVIAVLSRKLELTSAEKHVHNFMANTQLTKELKNSAANVIRGAWLVHKHAKLVKKPNRKRVRSHRRRFLRAVFDLRKVKMDQRKLHDEAPNLAAVVSPALSQEQSAVGGADQTPRFDAIERHCKALERRMDLIGRSLTQFGDNIAKLSVNVQQLLLQDDSAVEARTGFEKAVVDLNYRRHCQSLTAFTPCYGQVVPKKSGQ